MKKYLIAVFSAAVILSFISCGSTPTAEPNSAAPKAEEPPLVVEMTEQEEEKPAGDDFSKGNEALLTKADSARQKAISAGAEKYYPDVLAETDKYYDEVKADIKANPSADHSARQLQ